MSDEVVGDVCELLEVIETEQVVEILEHTQFLDLAAPMETRGEMPAGGCSDFCEVPAEERQLAGQKRKRVYVHVVSIIPSHNTISPTFLSYLHCFLLSLRIFALYVLFPCFSVAPVFSPPTYIA